jgi:hypothetical protein
MPVLKIALSNRVSMKNEKHALNLLKECEGNILIVGQPGSGKNSLVKKARLNSVSVIDVCSVMDGYPNDYVFTDAGFEMLDLDACDADVIVLDEVDLWNDELFKGSRLYKFMKSIIEKRRRVIVLTHANIPPKVATYFDGLLVIEQFFEDTHSTLSVSNKNILH